MTFQRDFLGTPTAEVVGSSPYELATLLREQTDVMRDIRLALLRQNPDVLCQTVVQNAGTNNLTISDTGQHKVLFMSGSKQRSIYQLDCWSTYGQTIYLALNSMGNPKDGIPIVSGNTLVLPVNVDAVWIWVPALAGSGLNINGNADTTNGGFNLLGFTIPEFEEHVR